MIKKHFYESPEVEMINLNITSMLCLSFGNDTEERQIEDVTEGDDWGTL